MITFSLWGRGDRLYCSINRLQHGGRKDNKGLVFLFLHSNTLLGFICSFVLGSPYLIMVMILKIQIFFVNIVGKCSSRFVFNFFDCKLKNI